jgi:hypothetical protein
MPTGFRFWRLALPLLIVLGFAGWSGYWFYAQARVQTEIERGVEHLQARGGDFHCEDRQWRGFPLRIALNCGRIRLDVPGGPLIETARIEAAGHLHSPRRIVAHTEQFAVGGTPWSFGGRNLAVTADSTRQDRLEFSASGEDLTFADGRMPALAIDALQVEGWIAGLPRTAASDFAALLREAARLGSRVSIETFRAQMAGLEFSASGTVELGPEGPTGTLTTTVSDYKEFLADLERRGAISRKAVRASAMMIGLLQRGRKTADGEATLALRFHEGQVFWGPFAVAEIPPLQ